jgi:hypothetical protein
MSPNEFRSTGEGHLGHVARAPPKLVTHLDTAIPLVIVIIARWLVAVGTFGTARFPRGVPAASFVGKSADNLIYLRCTTDELVAQADGIIGAFS